MKWLGLSGFVRSASAVLASDGRIIAAAREETFSSIPSDPSFPRRAAGFCLRQARISASDLHGIVWFEKPLTEFERVLVERLRAFPRESARFTDDMYTWLSDRLWIRSRITAEMGVPSGAVCFVPTRLAMERAGTLANESGIDFATISDLGAAAALGAVLIANELRGGPVISTWPTRCGPDIDDADLDGGESLAESHDEVVDSIRSGKLVGYARGRLGFLAPLDSARVLLFDAANPRTIESVRRATFLDSVPTWPLDSHEPEDLNRIRRFIPSLGVVPMLRVGETIPYDAPNVLAFARRAGVDALAVGERWFNAV